MEALSAIMPPLDYTIILSFLHSVAAILDPSKIVFRWIPISDNVLAHKLARKVLFRNNSNVKALEEEVSM
ncbi:hypothetical protein L484_018978 [Morus notabilis]|uniref:Uncharacterized protein n=1 Tax=Morus notabilis TaxID=981085 RepID=W9RSQ1_9ROSA|nr:hypothetical protein L484_018978 [Morus notabilis]